MSGDVPQKLVSALPKNASEVEWARRVHLEDVAITGLLRQSANVNVLDSFLFKSWSSELCKGAITFHSFSAEKLKPTYQDYLTQSLNCIV